MPDGTLHRTEESELHRDSAHPVWRTDILKVGSCDPKPAPANRTTDAPVDGALNLSTFDTVENPSSGSFTPDSVCATDSNEITTPLTRRLKNGALHDKLESQRQNVELDDDRPFANRARAL
jgi:hypothetical protein